MHVLGRGALAARKHPCAQACRHGVACASVPFSTGFCSSRFIAYSGAVTSHPGSLGESGVLRHVSLLPYPVFAWVSCITVLHRPALCRRLRRRGQVDVGLITGVSSVQRGAIQALKCSRPASQRGGDGGVLAGMDDSVMRVHVSRLGAVVHQGSRVLITSHQPYGGFGLIVQSHRCACHALTCACSVHVSA